MSVFAIEVCAERLICSTAVLLKRKILHQSRCGLLESSCMWYWWLLIIT